MPTSSPLATTDAASWTVDELASLTGLTTRTVRYYASLGLIPGPAGRRGRVAVYDDRHRIRLLLVKMLQDRGFALSGIEQQLARVPHETPPEELELRLAMVSSWAPPPRELLGREDLAQRAGRPLSDDDLQKLERLGTVRRRGDEYEVLPTFRVGVALLDLPIPQATAEKAGEAIREAMTELVHRLSTILREEVIEPFRAHDLAVTEDAVELEQMMTGLRALTLDAVVGNFQLAADSLTDTSWT